MLSLCGRGRTAPRNQAGLVMMWRAGLRVSEACAVEKRDINAKELTIRVRHGKGDKARTCPIDAEAMGVLQHWLDLRRKIGGTHVLCTLAGAPTKRVYWNAAINRLARRAGVEKRMHPHALRHAYTVELIQEGVHVVHIQRLLGHASLDHTMNYIVSLGEVATLDAVRTRKWARAMKKR